MRKILLSIFLFLLISSTAYATSDTVERYTTPSEFWETPYGYSSQLYVSKEPDPTLSANSVLKITEIGFISTNYVTRSKQEFSADYISFRYLGGSSPSTGKFIFSLADPTTKTRLLTFSITDPVATIPIGSKVEIIRTGSTYTMYLNGTSYQTFSDPGIVTNVLLDIGTYSASYNNQYILIDDISDTSIIGIGETINEGTSTFSYTWSAQLMRNYPSANYKIDLYSITNQNNDGLINSWDIPEGDNSTSIESGYVSVSTDSTVGNNFGLYLLEMKRDSDILSDTYFYYDSLSDPVGFPETLWLASSDVSADIRDYANNGGLISPDGSVYLFANNGTAGFYPISFEIQNTPYHFEATISKVYSSETINETNISFSGLTNLYNVALDGSNMGTASGSTFSYAVTDWENYTEHIFSFTPDLTQPGIYGYVKDLSTKQGIHGAVITISDDTYSTNIATDETGYYYLAGLPVGSTYTISAARSGYVASTDFSFTTSAGETSRNDIYLDPAGTGAGYYYAPHDVTFTVKQYWYSAPLPGVLYNVEDNTNTFKKSGSTDSKGSFTVAEMDQGTNYSINLTYLNTTYIKHIEPGLTEYTLILTEGETLHTYVNNWLTLSYMENNGTVTINYISTKPVSEASLTITAGDGSNFYSGTSSNLTQSFSQDLSGGSDYNILFEIEATDWSTASQAWSYSAPGDVDLFPDSYPSWLKNTLFGGIIILFMLSFGKSKNDVACILAALLCSMGYFFGWLICSFNFVVLIWLIAAGAAFLHYKRTGHLG